MIELDARKVVSAAAAGAVAGSVPPVRGARLQLSAAARLVAAEPHSPAYSPIVLAGFVRMIELALIAAIGTAIHLAYVVPVDGFDWHYPATALAVAAFGVLAFQAA